MTRAATILVACAVSLALSAKTGSAAGFDFVVVGDAGNAADTTGFGAVSRAYEIGKYDFTTSQYVQYLNAVDPQGLNPNAIWNSQMGSDIRGGIAFSSGGSSGAKYSVRSNMADKPVNFVTWFNAARVANWYENGAQTYGTTASGSTAINSGAYALNGITSGSAPVNTTGATYRIPTENEWYKAAYYKGGGTSAGYWNYGTQSNTAPTAVTATATGVGTTGGVSPVTSGNYANYNLATDWNGADGNTTNVGSNGGASAYGAFDMSGNVYNWNDLDGTSATGRGLRGGCWLSTVATDLSSSNPATRPAVNLTDNWGFRLASVVPASLTWNTSSGTWSGTALNWTNGKGGNYALAADSTATFSSVSGGTITVSGTVRPTAIVVSATAGSTTIATTTGNAVLGTGSLTKSGAGTLVLSGSFGFTGATAVQAGTLSLSGTLSGSAVTVGAGGNLAGSGFIGSSLTVLASGTLAPGDSPGRIESSSLTLQAGSTTVLEIVGVASGTSSLAGTAGTNYDTLVLDSPGGLTYGGALQFVFSNSSPFANGTTFDLFALTGTPTGDFASLSTAAGSSAYSGLTFTKNADGTWYSTDTAAHQYLRFSPLNGDLVVVPEPSTWVSALGGAALAGWMARRRNRPPRRSCDPDRGAPLPPGPPGTPDN